MREVPQRTGSCLEDEGQNVCGSGFASRCYNEKNKTSYYFNDDVMGGLFYAKKKQFAIYQNGCHFGRFIGFGGRFLVAVSVGIYG